MKISQKIPDPSLLIRTSFSARKGKLDPGDLILAVLADKSALEMLMIKSAIKADGSHAQISKDDQGPSTQAGAIKARQQLDPEITVIEANPPKKPRWDVPQPNTSSSADHHTDHEDTTDTEVYAHDGTTSAARWSASEELSSFLELVVRKPLTNFERETMCHEYPRPLFRARKQLINTTASCKTRSST